jgi:hypothetical protein
MYGDRRHEERDRDESGGDRLVQPLQHAIFRRASFDEPVPSEPRFGKSFMTAELFRNSPARMPLKNGPMHYGASPLTQNLG